VVITFDDGDRSVVDYAYPILQKHGFKATLFVVTSEVGRKWDGVDCLGWDDLRRLRESGVFSIQSHSHDLHRKVKTSEGTLPVSVAAQYGLYRFPGAPSWQKGVYDDLRTSRLLIEQHVGGEVNSLAWPYGFGEVALDSVAASAGFATLCTLGAGRNRRLPWASWVDTAGESIEEARGVAPVSAAPAQHDGFTVGKVSPGRRVLWERMEIRRYAVTARTSLNTFAKLVAE
jgi:peptidoglycan/xylan/chitin deacetylase (PgdA/CDA1 family)